MIAAARATFNRWHLNTQLMVILTLLNIVDFLTTKFLVDKLGFEAEANELLYRAMVALDSVYAILLIKVGLLAVLWCVYNEIEHHHKLLSHRRLTTILGITTAAYFALIHWNFFRVGQELSIFPI